MVERNDLNIIFVTTEIVPFSKVGGLADVMGALPDALGMIGCSVSVFTPLYASIDRQLFKIEPEPGIPAMKVTVAGKEVVFRLFSTLKPGENIKVYFIDNDRFYGRKGIYTVPENGKAFEDEDERTIFFNRAVIEAIKGCDLYPDIIHCNDFHTGLIPAYIEMEEPEDPHFAGTGTVFSVHNLAYQGNYRRGFLKKAGIDQSLFVPMSPFEYWGMVNVMKIGISFANMISTVSESYAEEIADSNEYGYGLEGVLRSRGKDLVGILNGIDPDVWNPETDKLIPFNFTRDNLGGKEKNRSRLLKEFGLPVGRKAPVIGLVSRLVDQKGFDIIAEAFDTLMKMNVKFVILGTGQQVYHDLYAGLARKYSKKLGLKLEFNDKLAHLVEAGSDFFLMASRYEPCGLNQMYSLRYGTIPIVRATGGLKDTIRELTRTGSRGNGFTFKEYKPASLISAVEKAVEFFRDKEGMKRVRRRIMKEDHSWQRSAKRYRKLYERAKQQVVSAGRVEHLPGAAGKSD